MTKYLKVGALLLCLCSVPSLGAAGCEGLDSSPKSLCQRLERIEANQQKILDNQEKIKRALVFIAEEQPSPRARAIEKMKRELQ